MQEAGSSTGHRSGQIILVVLALAVALLTWRATETRWTLATRTDEHSKQVARNQQLEAAHTDTRLQLATVTEERDSARDAQATAERRQLAEGGSLRRVLVQKGQAFATSQRHVAACAAFAAALDQEERSDARTGYMHSLALTPTLRWASPRPLPIRSVALSTDGGSVALWLERQNNPDILSVIDLLAEGKEKVRISLPRELDQAANLRALSASEQAKLVAVANDLGDVLIIEAASGQEQARHRWPEGVDATCLSPDGQLLAVATSRGEVAVVSMSGQPPLQSQADTDSRIADLCFDGTATSLLIGLTDGSTWSWNLNNPASKPKPDNSVPTIRTTSPPSLVTPQGDSPHQGPTLVLPPRTPSRHTSSEALTNPSGATPLAGVLISSEHRLVLATVQDARLVVTIREGNAENRRTTLWKAEGITRPLASVSMCDAGRIAASGDLNGQVSIWNTKAPGVPARQVTVHREGASLVAVSPDGALVASAGEDGAIRLLDAMSGEERHAFGLEGLPATRLAWSHSGELLAVGDAAGAVRIWSRDREEEIGSARLVEKAISALTLTEAPPSVMVVDLQGDIRVMRIDTGDRLAVIDKPATASPLAALSGDGHWLASASRDQAHQEIILWDLRSGGSQHLETPGAPLTCLALSPTGDLLVAGNDEGLVTAWDLPGASPRITLASHRGAVRSLELSGDHGRLLISGGADGTMVLHDLHPMKARRRPTAPTLKARSAAANPNGQQVALASAREPARLVDLSTNTDQAITARGHRRSIASLAFSADGALLASGARDGAVMLCAAETGEREARLEGHKGWTTALAFAASGRLLAAGSDDGTVRVTEVASRRRAITLTAHGVFIEALAFSPDEQRLVSGGQDPRVLVRELQGGRTVLTLNAHSGFIHAAAWSPRSPAIATGGGDGVVRLHHAEDGTPLAARRIGSTIRSLAFHPTDGWLAVGSDGPWVSILEIPTLKPLAEIRHDGEKAKLVSIVGGSATRAGRLVVVTDSPDAQGVINEIDLDVLHLGLPREQLVESLLERTGTRLSGLEPTRLGIELLRQSSR